MPESSARPQNFDPLRFSRPVVSEAERHRLIEKSAYLRAEQRGFAPGYDVADWLAAEAEVDARIARQPGS